MMIWSAFFRDGGFGMIPTFLFGMMLLGASFLYAKRPHRRYVPLLLSLGVVALGSGFLGFSIGMIHTLRFVAGAPSEEQYATTLIGVAESSNNVVLSLIALVLSALIASVGGLRVARLEMREAESITR